MLEQISYIYTYKGGRGTDDAKKQGGRVTPPIVLFFLFLIPMSQKVHCTTRTDSEQIRCDSGYVYTWLADE